MFPDFLGSYWEDLWPGTWIMLEITFIMRWKRNFSEFSLWNCIYPWPPPNWRWSSIWVSKMAWWPKTISGDPLWTQKPQNLTFQKFLILNLCLYILSSANFFHNATENKNLTSKLATDFYLSEGPRLVCQGFVPILKVTKEIVNKYTVV